ncbi:hypothetical protein GLYMA_06G118801v4 [Glycine max]|nr:hypothetical protein GLYMA_06G118801v4 [Glycine max]KAH1125440.1 hypothetical protein GYH30_014835 [Glycine max]
MATTISPVHNNYFPFRIHVARAKIHRLPPSKICILKRKIHPTNNKKVRVPLVMSLMHRWGRVINIVLHQIYVFLLCYVIKCRLYKLSSHPFNCLSNVPNSITRRILHDFSKGTCGCHCGQYCTSRIPIRKWWSHSVPTINQSGQPRRLVTFPFFIACFTHTPPQVPSNDLKS